MSGSEWVTVSLGDYVTFKTGKLDSNAATPDGAYPFFTCSRETFRTNTYAFDTECVLLAGNNANGIYPLKYFRGKFDAYQRTYIIRSKDKEVLFNRYLYFALAPKLEQLRNISTGATTKFLTLGLLNNLQIDLPPFPVQQKTAAILSSYDDLIENNTRRIQILEEVARSLYREWFVEFRFPDHENVPMVETEQGRVPQGWSTKRLADICGLTMGQSPESKFYNVVGEGLPFHQGVADFGDRFITDRVYCTVENRVAEAGDILFSVRAPVGRLNLTTHKIVIGRGVCAIRPQTNRHCFVFEQLKEKFQELDTMGNGAIFKAVTKDEVQGILMLVPKDDVCDNFEKIVSPIYRDLEILFHKNANLRRTRDLLLPKLISGEVDVSGLEISTGNAAGL